MAKYWSVRVTLPLYPADLGEESCADIVKAPHKAVSVMINLEKHFFM